MRSSFLSGLTIALVGCCGLAHSVCVRLLTPHSAVRLVAARSLKQLPCQAHDHSERLAVPSETAHGTQKPACDVQGICPNTVRVVMVRQRPSMTTGGAVMITTALCRRHPRVVPPAQLGSVLEVSR